MFFILINRLWCFDTFLKMDLRSKGSSAIFQCTAAQILEMVTTKFTELGIKIGNCRDQSYDTVSNMSGFQARAKELCSFAEHIPCTSDSLNLVGVLAAGSCTTVVTFSASYNRFTTSFLLPLTAGTLLNRGWRIKLLRNTWNLRIVQENEPFRRSSEGRITFDPRCHKIDSLLSPFFK